MNHAVVNRVDAVEADAQAHHVKLCAGEALHACGVADVAQDFVVEGLLQRRGGLLKELNLATREAIEQRRVAPHEMGEDGARNHGILPLEALNEARHLFGQEAQAVHAGIELHVDGEVGNALFLGSLNQGVEQVEAIDLGLELVVEHGLEGGEFGVHNDDIGRDARLAQLRAFVGHGHGQVIHPVLLQRLGNLVRAGSVGRSLHHADHLGLWLEETAVVVEVVHHGLQIDLENGFVHLLGQVFAQLVEVKLAGSLDEDNLFLQGQFAPLDGLDEGLGGGEKALLTP